MAENDSNAPQANDIDEEPPAKRMLPNFFLECHPITSPEIMEQVLAEPPDWVGKIEPLRERSSTVIQNIIKDCHSEQNHFYPRARVDARLVPKTLVCHDYKGGYLADRYLHSENDDISGNGYTFYNWAQIDYFVYFSHHFITIPPLCWINVGHKNGVKVLGTLITESKVGVDICNTKLFEDLTSMKKFAEDLVRITKMFQLDGWLLNIENKIDKPEILKEFVRYFTKLLHYDNSEAVVIWYDSVTDKGYLSWQNELNGSNKCFFDGCDGIFLNYGWNEKNLINSVEEAGHRNLDVFVGIDVFGRNFYEGGKFNTYKAAEMISKYNLSMAIFAPGWTHESIDEKNREIFFEQFFSKDSAFWCSLWPFLYTHPINSYFSSDFYIGLDKTCYNILNQKQQPSKFLHPNDTTSVPDVDQIHTLSSKCDCMKGVLINSKNSCLITVENLHKDHQYIHHLFACDLYIANNTLVYFLTNGMARMSVTMLTSSGSGVFRKIKLLNQFKGKLQNDRTCLEITPTIADDVINEVIRKHSDLMSQKGAVLRVYLFDTPPCKVMEIGATIENGNKIILRAFGIQNADGNILKTLAFK